MGRAYPELPVVGVGAVVRKGSQVLLIRRANPPSQGRWSLPGGALELGEKLTQAVAREVKEETGLDVRVGELLEVLESVFPDTAGRVEYHYILFDYVCWAGEQPARAASDALELAWFGLAECQRLDLWSETLRIITKALAVEPPI